MRFTMLMSMSMVALAAGCAPPPVPAKEIAATHASLRAADEVGAEKVPRAALHVKMARDQAELARRYMADEEMERARDALRRANLDAEVAVALSRENATRREAVARKQEAETMRSEAP